MNRNWGLVIVLWLAATMALLVAAVAGLFEAPPTYTCTAIIDNQPVPCVVERYP